MANVPFFPMEDLFGEEFAPVAPVRTAPHSCDSCGRYQHCKTPKFPVYGEGGKGILIVSEFPSASDDSSGVPLSGDSGAILHRELRRLGLDLKRDCWTVYVARCHSRDDFSRKPDGGIRGPKGPEVLSCRPMLHGDISRLRPRVIVPMGPAAIQGTIGHRLTGRIKGAKPTDFTGTAIPDQDLGAWVCPTEAPLYLLENEKKTDLVDMFRVHLTKAVQCAGTPLPPAPALNAEIIEDAGQAAVFLAELAHDAREHGWEVGFDYETTGIKPHAPGHKIVCASVAWDDKCAAFPMFEDPGFRKCWRALLVDPGVLKGAHNAQFEAMWTREILGYWPEGWGYDTCLDAHVINNNRPTNLKYEVFTRLGILGYDDGVDKYLESEEKGCNAFNRILEAPIEKVLQYCAMDSRYMAEVRRQQIEDLRAYRPQMRGSRFLLNASLCLAKTSQWGMRIETEKMEAAYRDLTIQIDKAEKEAYSCPEVVAMGQGFSLSSNKDLGALVTKLGYKSKTVDKEFLQTVDAPFVDHLLESRKLKKARDTYFAQYRREAVSGVIRGTFNLAAARTYRAGHSDPNLANIPKRDALLKKAIRVIYKPSPGNVLKEYDYGQIEVRIGACYHLDPNMLKYINDPTTNMHTDAAIDLFFRGSPAEVRKPERQAAKNGFVFPSFYGSNFEQTYLGIWKQIEPETKEHLKTKGIKDKEAFRLHVQKVERILWEDRFPQYARWKRDIYQDYKRRGYVELKTGFRCLGPMGYTDSTNVAIQGSAFHCLLWTILQIEEKVRAISGRSSIVCNIHDAMVIDMHPDDEAEIDRLVWDYGTRKVREHWPWIITPLVIEAERSAIDGSWAQMENCGELHFS